MATPCANRHNAHMLPGSCVYVLGKSWSRLMPNSDRDMVFIPDPVQITMTSSSAEITTKGMLAAAKACNRNTIATKAVAKRCIL